VCCIGLLVHASPIRLAQQLGQREDRVTAETARARPASESGQSRWMDSESQAGTGWEPAAVKCPSPVRAGSDDGAECEVGGDSSPAASREVSALTAL
jgi:hypothetical protein